MMSDVYMKWISYQVRDRVKDSDFCTLRTPKARFCLLFTTSTWTLKSKFLNFCTCRTFKGLKSVRYRY
jgi:hypothetical protein